MNNEKHFFLLIFYWAFKDEGFKVKKKVFRTFNQNSCKKKPQKKLN